MPIRITTIGRQRTVAGLAKALFDTKGSAALQERAEAALLRANPQLAQEGGIKAGLSIIVPAVRDLIPKGEDTPAAPSPPPPGATAAPAARAGEPPPDSAIGLAASRVRALADLGGQSLEAALADAKLAVKELKSEETATALRAAHPDFGERLEAVRGEADKEVKRITESGKQLREITAQVLADLAAMGDPPTPRG